MKSARRPRKTNRAEGIIPAKDAYAPDMEERSTPSADCKEKS